MRQLSRRFTGMMLISTAIVGLLISLAGVVGVWWVRLPLTHALTSSVGLAIGALETTSQGLAVVGQSLDLADGSVGRLEEAFSTLVTSLGDTVKVLDTLVTLSGRGLPATVQAAQISLRAAQASAQVLEGARFVDTGAVITSAGISAGIDMALHLVARLLGEETARETANYM
ncbi:MAG: hypothetical protein N3A60_11585, partial [Thermanaerothrix sp.]|nr:hypothetical protein [Thermanaerothrix sp.]